MHITIFISVLIAAFTGLVAKFILDKKNTQKEITDCYRDGPCRWEYDCDPYLVSYPCNCDDKGNCSTCYRTEYHDCPYVTQENSYYIKTTIGTYTIDSNRFPDNQKEWFDAMSYFDAAFGTNLQGDMHLVIVKNEYISSDPDRYALALKAYWQDKKRHGKDVLSKNAVVIICTTDGEKIIWARSFTGMPLGNESMLVALDNGLRGINLNSETLIGKTIGKLKNGKVESIHSDGVIEKIVFGLIDPSTKFKRVSMSAKDKDDNGRGFFYLVQQIQPTSGQRIFIYIGTFLFCSMGWIAAVIIGDRR